MDLSAEIRASVQSLSVPESDAHAACLVSHGVQLWLEPLCRRQCIREGALEGDADVGLLFGIEAHVDCGCGPSDLGELVRRGTHEELDDDLALVRDVSLAAL